MEHSVIKEEPESPSDGHVQLNVCTEENAVREWSTTRMGQRRIPVRLLNCLVNLTTGLCYCRKQKVFAEGGQAFCSVDCYIASLIKERVRMTNSQRHWVELTIIQNIGKEVCFEIAAYDNNAEAKLLSCGPSAENPGGILTFH
ncbi:unnamed protein product [Allacma fusca]|uniref:Uncharacterized protein n=1 Tax=Allacma fusca TaxID=39272 RepID=A0A8J2NV82_9HEXA|nr:unnamed protein product [Allacma fusca]